MSISLNFQYISHNNKGGLDGFADSKIKAYTYFLIYHKIFMLSRCSVYILFFTHILSKNKRKVNCAKHKKKMKKK